MAPFDIHVAGTGTNRHPAERSILTLHTQTKCFPTIPEAETSVVSIINSLLDAIAPYCHQTATTGSTKAEDNAPISHYSLKSFETSQGRDTSMSFSKSSSHKSTYASADLIIEFRDFALLARLATTIGAMENVKINCLEWILTPATRATMEAQARKEAAKHAIRKARDYAEVFGGLTEEEAQSKVRAVLVKESFQYTKFTKPKLHLGKANGGRMQKSEWDYEPQDVGVEVKVDGTFTVEIE
ncbi:hypothetical protein DPSP01_011111 [Paraphaeosphaeria sporulosa]|uniref:SIMPL domain-containing protein n=1 Tax=Paraphaeosphaeria sporulosa TaxID=1460663 RepID=A0A177C1H2_9PLEO|nr:uncharacterized protein CC84DRAFT_1167810 [Paraphaeosphaeria sporulosa]OAG01634.1 hypothetical protein CC84DRAFT_1167810 [Paraphaeosphaeria sporulosa]